MRFDIDKFDGITNFSLWQVRMTEILVQNDLKKVIIGKNLTDANQTEWEELDEKTLSTIHLCLTNNELQKELSEKMATTLWRKLEAIYMTRSLANRLVLKQRLYTYCMDEDVKGNLLSKEKLDNELGSGSKFGSQASFLVARGRQQPKALGQNKSRRAAESDEEQKAEIVDASVAKDNGDDWLLVSTTESSVESGVVLIGNSSPCKVISIGTVQINMHDRIIRTLSDIRHVPNLKKNLISLGSLDPKGCKIVIKSSDIKVSRQAFILIRGQKTDSLYVLQGSTVTGKATISLHVKESELTRLKHKQLSHTSEKGMAILNKKGSLLGARVRKIEHCVYGKQKRVNFDLAIQKSLQVSKSKYSFVSVKYPTKSS
ncbi:hypothetical protein CXB51_019548 [Gossypium anomalum]|uniref:Retrovirus-related Pol polyprotein from transposon TNT 1-94-like beta-barrel domain-containing protein n=1 Tax=Gossypium anomalum TaxID=47600 RepID=A0A8J5YL77_9ROSI|nr:hypothetical protein CXB51_019548 [Gossypium anomalum]